MSWECPKRKKKGGEAHILEAQKRDVEAEGTKYGRYLMMKKVLLKPKQDLKSRCRGTVCSRQLAILKTEFSR
jgi:hypothetical protein